MNKAEVKEFIKSVRPNLSAGSLNTYTSIITSLYRKLFNSSDYDLKMFNTHHKEVLEHLKDIIGQLEISPYALLLGTYLGPIEA